MKSEGIDRAFEGEMVPPIRSSKLRNFYKSSVGDVEIVNFE